jgi:uncharacterized protein (TIGR00299 family) protein
MKVLYLDCFSGLSGDMFLGALIDLGVPLASLQQAVDSLGLPEPVHFHAGRAARGSMAGIKVDVHCHDHKEPHSHDHDHGHAHHGHSHGDHGHSHGGHGHHHHDHDDHGHSHGRSYADIRHLLNHAPLAPQTRDLALRIFHRVAEAEARIHGKSVDEVHFHEVGALDSIADIVGAAVGVEYLGADRILASALVDGTGSIECAHGTFPLPAPATLEILKGIPLRQIDVPHELITPTGAAILAELASSFGPMPSLKIEKTGYGLGGRDIPGRPNAVRAILGESAVPFDGLEHDEVAVLETNLDDMTGEQLATAAETLREAGALDVSLTPLLMKKGRPGHLLSVLVPPADQNRFAALILTATTALGVRHSILPRTKLRREILTVPTSFGPVRVKAGYQGTDLVHLSPEHDDCVRLARENKVSPAQIEEAARQAAARPA